MIAGVNDLIDGFHGRGDPVVKIHTVHRADGSTWNQAMRPHWTGALLPGTLIERTREAQPHPGVRVSPADIVVTKTRGSAFLRTSLEAKLGARNIDTVVLAGYSIDRCVGLTAIDAWERDLRVILAGDAILATDPAAGEAMLDYLSRAFAIEPVSNKEIKRSVSGP